MLLREINRDNLQDNLMSPSPEHFQSESNDGNSPIKPLKFIDHHKDNNSSSDTCISENDENKPCLSQKHDDYDNFLFETPKNSTVNLNLIKSDQHTSITKEKSMVINIDEKIEILDTIKISSTSINKNSSPNKSAMKKSSSFSPKKVAFNRSDPEIHTYSANLHSDTSADIRPEPKNDDFHRNFETSWNDVSSNDSTPPLPPSRSVTTFENLLNDNSNANYNLDSSVLTDVKLKHHNFSNLSLNEKLDLYLSNNNNNAIEEGNFGNIHSSHSLDYHLNNLQYAETSKANTNINNLSISLQNRHHLDQNLYVKHELKRHSSGSSQSSLQSLREDNRVLNSNNTPIISEPIQLNDGIKGFPDKLANEIIPSTHSNSVKLHKENEFSDSFDKSYMSQSKSIMNLLNSASNLDIAQVKIKQEDDNLPVIEKTNEIVSIVKQEFTDEVDVARSLSIKSENYENAYNTHEEVQVTLVSDFGRSATSLKLVSTEVPKIEVSQTETLSQTQKINGETKLEHELDQNDESTKESIRFHMDSDWKLEDSNDGDNEDNDGYSNDFTAASQASILNKVCELLNTKSNETLGNSSTEFQDASQDLASRSTSTNPNVSLDENVNALANSSNVAPPEEITLPPIETNNYSSFEDVTKNINESSNSYEELLSAEHDKEPEKPSNFLSIWHLQELQRKHTNPRADEFFKVINREDLKDESQAETPIPASLKLKRFTAVNVITRRVVSPDFEDLQISNFLPELSEDSGLDGHFNFIANNNSFENNDAEKTVFNTKDILTDTRRSKLTVPPKRRPVTTDFSVDKNSRSLNPNNLMTPRSLKFSKQQESLFKKPKSKFKVPSFEIKRTDSLLSPTRDLYNDIFEDTVKNPTIVGHGMKTLPSMDHDDVKRILTAKRVISQDEYSRFKLVENKKNSVVNLPAIYNEQHASICESSTIYLNKDTAEEEEEDISHVSQQMRQAPKPLISKDQFFHDYDLFNKKDHQANSSQSSSKVNSVIHETKSDIYAEPDFDTSIDQSGKTKFRIVKTASDDQFSKTPEVEYSNGQEDNTVDAKSKRNKTTSDKVQKKEDTPLTQSPSEPSPGMMNTPTLSPKKKPIKIGSPLKSVKTGSSILLESPKKRNADFGGELVNHKLRDSPRKPHAELVSEHAPSTVSVPTVMTESTINKDNISHTYQASESCKDIKDEPLIDNGRLFFRIVGFKNIALNNFKDRNGEFTITLDNGIHSIKTPPYQLKSSNVLIDKEFELTVNGTLQFILTMKMRYEKPMGTLKEVRERKVVKAQNRLSRLLGQKDIVTTTRFVPVDIEDPWKNKFAEDGSFARCYIDLDQFGDKVTGQIGTFNINCFNEWETIAGSKSEKLKGKPYVIGQLEVKMLFVPRTSLFEVLPTSMKSGFESIQQLKDEMNIYNEGYMHQEGGDCETWKRRFFKLYGTSLIAHSEFSHKTRAKINLSKVVDVIYVDTENKNNPKNYRNFSEVILLDHAFKIKFADGEVIDFGPPNNVEKVQWIKLIEDIVGRNKFRRQPWVKLMLKQATETS